MLVNPSQTESVRTEDVARIPSNSRGHNQGCARDFALQCFGGGGVAEAFHHHAVFSCLREIRIPEVAMEGNAAEATANLADPEATTGI